MTINVGKLLRGAVKTLKENPALAAKVVKAVPAIGLVVTAIGITKALKSQRTGDGE